MAEQDNNSGGGFLAGLLVGGTLGALVALLYAPQRGDETRDLLKQRTDTYSELAKTRASDLTAKAADLSEAARSRASELSEKVGGVAETVKSRGAEVGDTVVSKAGQVADVVKSTATDLSTKATSAVSAVRDNAQSSIADGKQAAADKKRELVETDAELADGAATAEDAQPSASI